MFTKIIFCEQSEEDIHRSAFEKLVDQITQQFSSHSREITFYTKHLTQLAELEDAVLDNCVIKYAAE